MWLKNVHNFNAMSLLIIKQLTHSKHVFFIYQESFKKRKKKCLKYDDCLIIIEIYLKYIILNI